MRIKQTAMVLTYQKPTQRNRFGESPEGLPGSTLERGMRGEKHTRTWETLIVPGNKQVGQSKERPKTIRESDQLILLGGRESRPHGEGADRDT